MTMFYRHTKGEYIEALRIFLHAPKQTFKRRFGFTNESTRRGSPGPRYPVDAMLKVEHAANAKAARVEAPDTQLAERYLIARDYMGMSNTDVARAIGVSRELARRWGIGKNRPTALPALAQLLNVPPAWLEFGGEHHLPADTHLGIRVGDESRSARESLFALTTDALTGPSESEVDDDDAARVLIELAVKSRPDMARHARHAGGRWQVIYGRLQFAPWVPIPKPELSRSLWCDEVEEMITAELATRKSVRGAWQALKSHCEAHGLAYPKRITLYKRIAKVKEFSEKFGVDINGQVAASLNAV